MCPLQCELALLDYAQVLGSCVLLALGGPNLCDGDKIGAIEHTLHSIQSEELPAEAMSFMQEGGIHIYNTHGQSKCAIYNTSVESHINLAQAITHILYGGSSPSTTP